MRRAGFISRSGVLAIVLAAALPATASATTINVSGNGDGIAAGGGCTLREAIQAANANAAVNECPAGAGTDTVVLGAGTFKLSVAGAGEDANASGDLDLLSDMTVRGAGAGRTTIDADGVDRVLQVQSGRTVTLDRLTLNGGRARDGQDGSGLLTTGEDGSPGEGGGGILNAGTLTVTGSDVTGNAAGAGGHGGTGAGIFGPEPSGAPGGNGGDGDGGGGGDGGDGGGILSTGPLTVERSAVTSNSAGPAGYGEAGFGGRGGQSHQDGGAGGHGGRSEGGRGGNGGAGGGIAASGALTIVRSRIAGNAAERGGDGGEASNALSTLNSHGGGGINADSGSGGASFGGNGGNGGSGGGVLASAALTLTDSTFDGNAAGTGGNGGAAWGGAGGDAFGGTSMGGQGGFATSGAGGRGGVGGGLSTGGPVTAFQDTISSNRTGGGGDGGSAQAGDGGDSSGPFGPPGVPGGRGGDASAGLGGSGGNGGGASVQQSADFRNGTWSGNSTGHGGAGATNFGGQGGNGAGDGNGGRGGNATGGAGGNGGPGGALSVDDNVAVNLQQQTIASNALGGTGPVGSGISGLGGNGGSGGSLGDPGSFSQGASGQLGRGGAVWMPAGQTLIAASILAGNELEDCGGGAQFLGSFNVVASTGGCPGSTAGDPKLSPLADNGGPTPTRAIRPGSAAIAFVPAGGFCLPMDQRGVGRPSSSCDAGAYEASGPDVATGAAGNVRQTTASLRGQVAPNGRAATYHFEYGKTTAYGTRTRDTDAGSGVPPRAVSAAVNGLRPNTPYHYRVVASNADGASVGADRTFKTAATPVAEPPPLGTPFAGVRVVTRKARVRKGGIIRVKLACPASTAGSCTGRLTLSAKLKGKRRRIGRRSFSIAAGKSRTLRIRISRTARRVLARRRKLTARATAVAHDGNGTPRTSRRTVRLRR